MVTMTNKKNRKGLIIGCVVLAAVIALFAGIYFATRPDAQEGAKNITVTVVHKDLTEKVFEVNTDAENLEEVLLGEKIVEDNQTEYGLYILTADGETVNEANAEWWCITKGGEMLMTGAKDTMIADGDEYELTFTVGW